MTKREALWSVLVYIRIVSGCACLREGVCVLMRAGVRAYVSGCACLHERVCVLT